MLRGARVGDLLERDCPVIEGSVNLQTFVDRYLLRSGRQCFLVGNGENVRGLVTPNELKGIDRALWPNKTVAEVMRPLDQLRAVTPDTSVAEALEIAGSEDSKQVPVVKEGHLEGFISRDRILRLLQTRHEFNM
jgi:predicted transcriptional regulator